MNKSYSRAKAALLAHMQSLFPEAIKLPSMLEHLDDDAAITLLDHEQHEMYMLPYWTGLGGAYQEALAVSISRDSQALATQIEDRPASLAAQQKAFLSYLKRVNCVWLGLSSAHRMRRISHLSLMVAPRAEKRAPRNNTFKRPLNRGTSHNSAMQDHSRAKRLGDSARQTMRQAQTSCLGHADRCRHRVDFDGQRTTPASNGHLLFGHCGDGGLEVVADR